MRAYTAISRNRVFCDAQVKRLNVWWESEPPGRIRSLKMSTSAKQSWVQKCSCTHPALDGLLSFYSLHQSYFRPCICSSLWHADVSVCVFRWAEHSEVHDAQAPLPYLFLLPHTISPFCASQLLNLTSHVSWFLIFLTHFLFFNSCLLLLLLLLLSFF